MLSMKLFFQNLFVWQENDLVFSSEFEKITSQQQQHNNSPPSLHTSVSTHIKNKHDKVSISGSQGKGTQIFYKRIKSCVIVDFNVEDWCVACIV